MPDYYEKLGFKSRNFIVIMGSILILLTLIVLVVVINELFLNLLVIKCVLKSDNFSVLKQKVLAVITYFRELIFWNTIIVLIQGGYLEMFIQSYLTIMRPEIPQEEEGKVDKEEIVYTGEQRAIVYAWVCAVVAIALPFVFYSVVLLRNNKCSKLRYTSIGDFMKKYLPKKVKDKYCDENEDK